MASDASRRSGSLGGIPMKYLSLATLTFQNSALILVMHYSRIMPPVNGQRYHASTSVLLNEIIKLGISLSMALYEMSKSLPPNTPATSLVRSVVSDIFANDSWKLAVPAVLYTIQNTLQYVAVSNLDAATFQVTYQLKILTTALFSVLLLGRVLSKRQWLSLLVLIVGVCIVQFPHAEPSAKTGDDTESSFWSRTFEGLQGVANHYMAKRSATYEGIEEDVAIHQPEMNRSVGLLAVTIACALSGLAGVSFEKILKQSTAKDTSLWTRNCQLSFWSLFPAFFLGVVWNDGANIAKTGFFAGYNWVVWAAILLQAFGGVVVALVINYADNIAKNFATSISIILSCVASVFFFDFVITASFIIGTTVVLYATYLYTSPNQRQPAPVNIAEYEETTIDGNPSYFDKAPRGSGSDAGTPGADAKREA